MGEAQNAGKRGQAKGWAANFMADDSMELVTCQVTVLQRHHSRNAGTLRPEFTKEGPGGARRGRVCAGARRRSRTRPDSRQEQQPRGERQEFSYPVLRYAGAREAGPWSRPPVQAVPSERLPEPGAAQTGPGPSAPGVGSIALGRPGVGWRLRIPLRQGE